MSEWKEVQLGEIATIIDSRHKTPKYSNEGLPMVRAVDIKGGKLNLDDALRVSQEVYDDFSKGREPQIGDLIISRVGHYLGRISYVDDNSRFCLGQNIAFIIPEENWKFLYYQLVSPGLKYQIKNLSVGAAQPTLSLQSIKELYITLPTKEEQEFIGGLLGNLDKKITLLRQQNQDLEELAQTLFKRWFVEFEFPFDFAQGKPNENGEPLALSGAEGYKSSGGKMVESELGEIPEGWKVEHLRTQITATKGLSYKGAGLSDEGTVMHSLKSILEGGGYRHDGIKYYNAEYKERHIVRSGDIIVANTEQGEKHMLIGYPARIPNYSKGDSIFTHHLTKVEKLPESSYTNEFIYYSLMCKQLRHQIISYTNGTTVNGLPADGLLEPVWIVPSKDILDSFAQVISANWHKQENNYEEIQTLTQLRDTLLPKLMSGELKVKNN